MAQANSAQRRGTLSSYTRLVRFPNLMMVGLTLIIFQGKYFGFTDSESLGDFIVLLLAVVSTTAAGYIINDIYDQKADLLNKPSRMVVGKILTLGAARKFYFFLLVFAAVCMIYLFLSTNHFLIPLVVVATNLALYFYAAFLKATKMWGNILVAFLSAIVILLVPLSHLPPEDISKWMWHLALAFSAWAFIASLARELVKDLQDRQGDQVAGYRTLAIANESLARGLVWGLLLIQTAALLVWTLYFGSALSLAGHAYLVLLVLLSLLLSIRTRRATEERAYQMISQWLKIYLAVGIFFIIFWNVQV